MQRRTYCEAAMALAEAEGCPPDCRQALLNVVDCALGLYRDGECLDFDHLAAAIGAIVAPYVPPVNACIIETGTYTGDGTVAQVINLVDPALVIMGLWIWPRFTSYTPYGGATADFVTSDAMAAGFARYDIGTNAGITDNRITVLGVGTFTVDDAGVDTDPNTDQQVYAYLALGVH